MGDTRWDYSTPTLELDMWDYVLGADEMYEETFSNREHPPEEKRRKCRIPPGFEGSWGQQQKTPTHTSGGPPTAKSCGSRNAAARGILFSPCGRLHGSPWVA